MRNYHKNTTLDKEYLDFGYFYGTNPVRMNYPVLMSFWLWNIKEGHKQVFCPKINIVNETYSIL